MSEKASRAGVHVAAAGLFASAALASPVPSVAALAIIVALTVAGRTPAPSEEAPA